MNRASYPHFHWHEMVADEPAAILAEVERMFKALAELPRTAMYPRRWPTIERGLKDFESDTTHAVVSFRLDRVGAIPQVQIQEEPTLVGFSPPILCMKCGYINLPEQHHADCPTRRGLVFRNGGWKPPA